MAISAARPNIVTLQILHTNDVHSHVEMLPYIATAMKQAQARCPDTTLIVDAGDQLEGTVAGDLDHGAPMARIMGAMGYQYVTRGNHDWKWGLSALNEWDAQSKAHVVLANVRNAEGTLLPNTKPFEVAKVGGVSVGILGLLTTDTKNVASNEAMAGAQFDDEAQTLAKYEPQLHSDVEMVLDHCGKAADEKMATYQPANHGPLFFVGGHSHDTIDKPDVVSGNPIVQAGCYGAELGALQIDYDTQQHKVVGYRHEIIPIDPKSMQADPAIASMVAKYQAQADAKMSKVVATLPAPLTRSGQHDSTLGNMVTDAMRQAVGADVAFINSDGLRSDLPSGQVNLQNVYNVFPFECKLMKGTLTGQDIQAAMEHSATFRPDPDNWHASTMQVSGMTVHYDHSKPEGQRVTSIQVNGEPLDPKKSYTVAMRDYLAEGKLGYTMFGKPDYQPTHIDLFDAMSAYLAHPSSPIPAPTGRIIDDTPK
ncbi:MAG TPA: bifunctional UDP-sugar hydrolase/5'-nucleotidase [Candidatus Xenobia bacterium]|jgi:2',3'-cyclic-nucleotide 2'-phosphodiesterase (5'-nucleotidase family)